MSAPAPLAPTTTEENFSDLLAEYRSLRTEARQAVDRGFRLGRVLERRAVRSFVRRPVARGRTRFCARAPRPAPRRTRRSAARAPDDPDLADLPRPRRAGAPPHGDARPSLARARIDGLREERSFLWRVAPSFPMRFEPIESALLRVEHDLYHPRHGAYAERRRTDPADASPWRTRGCDDEWYGSLHGPVDLVDDLAGDDDEDSPALVVRGARERWRAGRIDENGRYELLEDGGNALGLTGVPDAGAVTDIERAAVDSEDAIHVRVRDARRRARRTQRGRASLQITCAYGGATRRFERATWDAVERDAVEWFHAQDGELVEAA